MARTTPVNSGYSIINGAGTGSNGSYIDVWLEYKVTSQNIAGNYSVVDVWFYAGLKPGQSSKTQYVDGRSSKLTVNGTAVNASGGYNFTNTSPNFFGRNTQTVYHNADGSKQISLSGSFTTRSTYISGGNVSGTITLQTIPRATTPSISPSSVAAGSTVSIILAPASSSFSHDIKIAFGSFSKQTTLAAGNNRFDYVVPLGWLAAIPNTTSAIATVVVTTKQGNTVIGSSVSRSFTLTAPLSIAPSITGVGIVEANSKVPGSWGAYVQLNSKLKIDVAAAGVYGSSITTYKIAVNEVNYTAANITTDVLKSAGQNVITVTVTDSRGRSATTQRTIDVLPYEYPYITTFRAYRTDENGNEDENGNKVTVYVKGGISPVDNKNTASYKIFYKKVTEGEDEWKNKPFEETGFSIDQSIAEDMNADSTWDVKVEVKDAINDRTLQQTVATAKAIMDFRHTGEGIAFGKIAESDTFTVAMPAVFEKNVSLHTPLSVMDGGTGSSNTNGYEALWNLGIGNFLPKSIYSSSHILMRTDIKANSDSMLILRIWGNAYNARAALNITVQAYNYNSGNVIMNVAATSIDNLVKPAMSVFNYNGYVYFYMEKVSNYQTTIAYLQTQIYDNLYEKERNHIMELIGVNERPSSVSRLVNFVPKAPTTMS